MEEGKEEGGIMRKYVDFMVLYDIFVLYYNNNFPGVVGI